MARALAFDLGTTEIAAVVFDARAGRVVTVERRPTLPAALGPPGRSERDAAAIVLSALDAGRAVVEAAGGAIDAIAVTGQMHGGLLVGDDLRPLTPLVDWRDQRGDEVLDDGLTLVQQIRQVIEGLPGAPLLAPATGYLGVTLCWLKRHGGLPPNAHATFLPDYLVACLRGHVPCTDPTDAASGGLYDAAAGTWSGPTLDSLGLPASLLPQVRPTGGLVGTLATGAAVALGLPSGVPVMNALGDNQASYFGSVGDPERDVLANVGTGSQVSVSTTRIIRSARLETRPLLPPQHLVVGSELAGGAAYALLRDFMADVARELGGDATARDPYPLLNELAASVPPGADGLTCDPRFDGARDDPGQSGSLLGIRRANFTPGHVARAVLEGTAEALARLYREMVEHGVAPRARLVVSGNAARRNPVLRACLAERFGMPLVLPRHDEEATVGAALLALVAVGALADLPAACALIRYD
jgi:sugar (pentulose or hexulose) kinase